MTTRLLAATTNAGKIREIRQILERPGLDLVTLEAFASIPEPDENGRTFHDNAVIKARAYASATGLPTVAEDSGLVIDALGGRPGVESARYPGRTYAEKFANLYRELAGHPRPWPARFVCSLAYVENGQVAFSCEATVEGEIAPAPAGAGGFGYDPVFFYPPYGRTLGDVNDAEKLAIAHRGKAFRQFGAWLAARADGNTTRG